MSSINRVCQSAFIFGKRGGNKKLSLSVKWKHDPGLNKIGKILQDGGREANRLWEERCI